MSETARELLLSLKLVSVLCLDVMLLFSLAEAYTLWGEGGGLFKILFYIFVLFEMRERRTETDRRTDGQTDRQSVKQQSKHDLVLETFNQNFRP